MHGPEYMDDEELLRRSIMREGDLARRVRELERNASELERERDEAREAASASRDAYEELEEAYRKEGPRTEGRGNWQAGWEKPSPCWSFIGHQHYRVVASTDLRNVAVSYL